MHLRDVTYGVNVWKEWRAEKEAPLQPRLPLRLLTLLDDLLIPTTESTGTAGTVEPRGDDAPAAADREDTIPGGTRETLVRIVETPWGDRRILNYFGNSISTTRLLRQRLQSEKILVRPQWYRAMDLMKNEFYPAARCTHWVLHVCRHVRYPITQCCLLSQLVSRQYNPTSQCRTQFRARPWTWWLKNHVKVKVRSVS